MIRTSESEALLCTGGTVVDPSGEKIGDVQQIFLNDDRGEAAWVTVTTGRFGPESLVPLREGVLHGTTIQVPYDRSKVKRAALLTSSPGAPTPAEARRLYIFYGCAEPVPVEPSRMDPDRVHGRMDLLDQARMNQGRTQSL